MIDGEGIKDKKIPQRFKLLANPPLVCAFEISPRGPQGNGDFLHQAYDENDQACWEEMVEHVKHVNT